MKKLVTFFILLLLFRSTSFAQLWQTITPDPEPSIYKASVPDTMHIRAISFRNTFHYSNDGGITWLKNQLHDNYSIDIDFIDANEGWISSDSGLLHTTDGGQTFLPVTLPFQCPVGEIQFLNHLNGKVLSLGVTSDSILITDDGGVTWNAFNLGPHNYNRRIYFTSPIAGWMIVNADTNILKTFDGGISWIQQSIPSGVGSSLRFESSVFFLDSLQGWISGTDSLMHTIDGGNSWNCISHIGFGSITFRDSLNGIISLSSSQCVTHDGGFTWSQLNIFEPFPANDLWLEAAISNNKFFLSGSGYVVSSYDGDVWKNLAINSFPTTLSVYLSYWTPKLNFSSRQKGMFKSGSSSSPPYSVNEVYRTIDSGKTWKSIDMWPLCSDFETLNDSLWFSCIYYYNDTSVLSKSTDNFNTPGQIIGTFPGRINSIYFRDSLHGFVGGDILKYTNDGGVNWLNSSYTPGSGRTIAEITFSDSLHGWLNASDSIIRTTDGGLNWNTIFQNPSPFFTEMQKLKFVDSLHGFFLMTSANDTTVIYETSDGGINWLSVNLPFTCRAFYFIDSLHGWMATHFGVYYTVDGLATVTKQDDHSTELITFYDRSHGYAASNSLLLYSDQSGVLNYISEKRDHDSVQLFPNPASNSFQIVTSSNILSVYIYDVMGKITKKMDGNKTRIMQVNLNLTSGIYFVSMSLMDGRNIVRKLIVD